MAAGGNGEPSEKGHTGKVDIIPGWQVWCKTRFEEIQGTVSAYDQANGVLIIKSPCANKTAKANSFDVSVVNLRQLQKQNFRLLHMPNGSQPSPPELDFGKVNRRLKQAIAEKTRKAERLGINVTKEAQLLFNSIANFMPDCKWNGDNIIVMDDVIIEPPYKPDNCSGERKESLEQLRKMVEKFHNEKQNDC